MTRLDIKWPDQMQEQVRASRGRLERAGEALREMPLEVRLRSIAQVLEEWTAPDSPWRRELAVAFAADTGFHENTVREGLDAAFRAWKPADFLACGRRELSSVLETGEFALSPFDWTAVLAGGSVPMPTMLNVLIPLVLGSPVLLRETSDDRATASLLKRSLEAHDAIFARAFEYLTFDVNDSAFDTFLEAPCVVATGSDETIRSVSARLRPDQRLLAYGHQFSIGVIGPNLQSDAEAAQAVAEGLALDIARWDQTGCLSPVVVYLVEGQASAEGDFAKLISEALARLSLSMPRREMTTAVAAMHASERAEARMRQSAGGSDRETLLFEGAGDTVILESSTQARPAPLYRFLRLMPVESISALARALAPFTGHLSNVAIAGFAPADLPTLHQQLARLGASRFTDPGRLQTPPIDWPHDGLPLFTPIARFVGSS